MKNVTLAEEKTFIKMRHKSVSLDSWSVCNMMRFSSDWFAWSGINLQTDHCFSVHFSLWVCSLSDESFFMLEVMEIIFLLHFCMTDNLVRNLMFNQSTSSEIRSQTDS